MRVLSWNVNGGPSDSKLEWLLGQPWDVAILMEVSARGASRLREHEGIVVRCVDEYLPESAHRGKRLMVAVCAREGLSLDAAYPVVGFEEGTPFAEQCMAVDVSSGDHAFTVVGFHAPNAADRGQAAKESAFERLATWLRSTTRVVVLGTDTNTWARGVETPNPDPDSDYFHQYRFQVQDSSHPLVDTYRLAAQARPNLADPSVCWTYDTDRGGNGRGQRVRMDQLYVPPQAEVLDAGIAHAARDLDAGLSDHAAVWADLEL